MRRRFRFSHLVLLGAFVAVAGCNDSGSTSPQLSRVNTQKYATLSDYIQAQIDAVLPKGFEDAVDTRWSTVKSKKNSGDVAGAVKVFNTLAMWIDKKTSEITPYPGHTKQQDAALLVLNMARWQIGRASCRERV